jgi:hypothetical protein
VPLWGDVSSSSTIVRVRPSAAAPVVVKGSVEDIWSLDEMISIVMVSFWEGFCLVSILIVVTF